MTPRGFHVRHTTEAPTDPREKVRGFPTSSGVYLMKDAQGRVIYVGKAKNLRSRAGSLLPEDGRRRPPHRRLVGEIADIDFIAADSEVDALLLEARLIKDIQPKLNVRPQGRQDVPVPADHHGRGLPAGRIHPRAARPRRQALRPVHQRQEPARGDPGAAADLQVPHLLARHRGGRPALAMVPAVPARTRSTSAPPRATSGSTARTYRKDIRRLRLFLEGKKDAVLAEMEAGDAARRARPCSSRRPPASATRSRRSRTSNLRGDLDKHAQPEVFYIDPKKGLTGLQKVLELRTTAADDRGRRHRPPRRHRHGRLAGARSSTACRSSRATGASRSRA